MGKDKSLSSFRNMAGALIDLESLRAANYLRPSDLFRLKSKLILDSKLSISCGVVFALHKAVDQ